MMDSRNLFSRSTSTECSITVADATMEDMPLIYVSSGFERLTGYSEREVVGRNCRFLQRDEREQEGVAVLRRALELDEACSTILLNYDKDGAPFWNQLNMAPVFDREARVTHVVGVQNGVTQTRALQYLREHCPAETEQDQIAGFEQLLQTASQDLKEPYAEVEAFRRGLQRSPDQENVERQAMRRRTLEGIIEVQLVLDGLMTLSRLSGTAPALRPCDFSQVMQGVANQFGPLLAKYGITTSVEALPRIQADASRVETMLRLLVRDSLDLPEERLPSKIALVQSGSNGGKLRVTYEDDRKGVTEEELGRITRLFHDMDRPNSSYPSQLDMAACKSVMTQHGGTIAVREREHGGIAFDLDFETE